MNDNYEMIKDRIAHILRAKNLTATQFAEIMQIQPSNVSHILNGRNKPSLDFVMKLKDVFPEYSFDWIIMGKKPITNSDYNLFSKDETLEFDDGKQNNMKGLNENDAGQSIVSETNSTTLESNGNESNFNTLTAAKDNIKQIICVYDDNTFEVYNVRK